MALIQHMADSDPSFEERKSGAYYVNPPRKIARLISNFLPSPAPQRDGADTNLIDGWSRDGRSVDDVMVQRSGGRSGGTASLGRVPQAVEFRPFRPLGARHQSACVLESHVA